MQSKRVSNASDSSSTEWSASVLPEATSRCRPPAGWYGIRAEALSLRDWARVFQLIDERQTTSTSKGVCLRRSKQLHGVNSQINYAHHQASKMRELAMLLPTTSSSHVASMALMDSRLTARWTALLLAGPATAASSALSLVGSRCSGHFHIRRSCF